MDIERGKQVSKYHKITYGWVTQIFDKGKCVSQEFFAGDSCDYEDEDEEHIDAPDDETYQEFTMVQPEKP